MEVVAIACFSIVFVVLYILSIIIMSGHGGEMVSGYHYQPKLDKAKKPHKYVMFRVGFFTFLLVVLIHAIVVVGIMKYKIALYVLLGIVPVYLLLWILYFVKNKHFKAILVLLEQLEKEEKSNLQSVDNL